MSYVVLTRMLGANETASYVVPECVRILLGVHIWHSLDNRVFEA
jgi:hypothetical protein